MKLCDIFSKNKEYAKVMPFVFNQVHTGIKEFDESVSFGFFPGNIAVITSYGHVTEFVLDIALANARRRSPTAVFCSESTIDKMAKQLWISLAPSEGIRKTTPLYLEEIGNANISTLKKRITKLTESSSIKLVIIDSIDYIDKTSKDLNSKCNKLFEFMYEIKALAKELEIVVIITTGIISEESTPGEYVMLERIAKFVINLETQNECRDKRRIKVSKNGDKVADLLVRYNDKRSTFHYMK